MTGVTRPTTERECAAVRPLVVAHAVYERSSVVVPVDWAARISVLIASGRIQLFVATDAGEPIGYATLAQEIGSWSAAPFAHLDCLFVSESHRSAGIGRVLMDAVIDAARDTGVGRLQWHTPDWNEGAIRFYGRLGAQQSSKERFTIDLT